MASKFDQNEVAKKLGISVSSILRDIEAGKVHGSQVGSVYLFTIRDLERYIGARRTRELFLETDGSKQEATAQGGKSIGPPVKGCEDCGRLRPAKDFEYDGTTPDWLGKICYACRRKQSGRSWPPKE